MCGVCEALGHGECGDCGGPTWAADQESGNQANEFEVDGLRVCYYCAVARGVVS